MYADKKTARKLTASVVAIIILLCLLTATTLALIFVSVEVKDNFLSTGTIDINLNDGEPIIDATNPYEEFRVLEPGMTIRKDFFVENLSSEGIFYRVYMDDIKGSLATRLTVLVKDGDQTLYSGPLAEMTHNNVLHGQMEVDERRELTIWFHCPESTGNEIQGAKLTFVLRADAVQTRNNDSSNPF